MIAAMALIVSGLLFWAHSEEVRKQNWNKDIKNRINAKLQASGMNFNTTSPKGEYHFYTKPVSCFSEGDWQKLEIQLNEIINFMRTNAPSGSRFYSFEKCPLVYIGYTSQTFIGSELIGYEIHLNNEDC